MIYDTEQLFLTDVGSRVFDDALRAVGEHSMLPKLNSGVVVGLSGGADSVMLLSFLIEYGKRFSAFPILCVHVNHMIRGEEADRDELFSRELCKALGVDFISERIDIPRLARDNSLGIEEAARKARYALFERVMNERGYCALAVAHNATDNLETVLYNMMRGAGSLGVAGIPPVRDRIVRPLIYVPKADILSALSAVGIEYCTDSTNSSTDYTRNYIRHEILPRLCRLAPSPERMATRLSANLREDNDYLQSVACEFFESKNSDGSFSAQKLRGLSKPIFTRVLTRMAEEFTAACTERRLPERVHINAIYSLLFGDKDFSYSLPGEVRFVLSKGIARLEPDTLDEAPAFNLPLSYGLNRIDGYSTAILVCDQEQIKNYLNVYKIEILAKLSSDIIADELLVRSRADGDRYCYGGITRRLKKLYNDKKIPPSLRNSVPVFCDKQGIVWVAGFGVRDGAKGKDLVIALAEPICEPDKRLIKLCYSF